MPRHPQQRNPAILEILTTIGCTMILTTLLALWLSAPAANPPAETLLFCAYSLTSGCLLCSFVVGHTLQWWAEDAAAAAAPEADE